MIGGRNRPRSYKRNVPYKQVRLIPQKKPPAAAPVVEAILPTPADELPSIQKYKILEKQVARAIRYLVGEIKIPPRFITQLGKQNFTISGPTTLLYGQRIIVPRERVQEVIREFDADISTAGGRDKLYFHIQKNYVGITKAAIMSFLKNSVVNQLTSPIPKKVTNRPIVITKPGIFGQVDLVDFQDDSGSNNGNRYVMTYIDLHSKLVGAAPMRSKEQPQVLKAFDAIMSTMPVSWRPRTIQSDRGSEFQVQWAQHLKKKYGQRVVYSQAYNPTSQGAVERLNKTIKSALFKSFTKYGSRRWLDILPLVVQNVNSSPQATTKAVPLDVMKGNSDVNVLKNIRTAAEKVTERTGDMVFKVGDSVEFC